MRIVDVDTATVSELQLTEKGKRALNTHDKSYQPSKDDPFTRYASIHAYHASVLLHVFRFNLRDIPACFNTLKETTGIIPNLLTTYINECIQNGLLKSQLNLNMALVDPNDYKVGFKYTQGLTRVEITTIVTQTIIEYQPINSPNRYSMGSGRRRRGRDRSNKRSKKR